VPKALKSRSPTSNSRTLAILWALSQEGLDAVILEVGLGGRLDAVNIIDTDCAIITSIDLDHMELLGNDRETIGFEKAGIMRTGRAVVVSDPVPPESALDRALEIGADLWQVGTDFNVSRADRKVLGPLGRAAVRGLKHTLRIRIKLLVSWESLCVTIVENPDENSTVLYCTEVLSMR